MKWAPNEISNEESVVRDRHGRALEFDGYKLNTIHSVEHTAVVRAPLLQLFEASDADQIQTEEGNLQLYYFEKSRQGSFGTTSVDSLRNLIAQCAIQLVRQRYPAVNEHVERLTFNLVVSSSVILDSFASTCKKVLSARNSAVKERVLFNSWIRNNFSCTSEGR